MYTKINITENTLLVLSLFTNGFDKEHHIREVGKALEISPRTAQLILEDLENKGVLESKMRGKIKSYKIKTNDMSRRYFVFAEQYKSIIFMEQNLLIKEIIEKVSPHIKGVGVVFGSYAKGTADRESDVDIFVAGEYDQHEIEKISATYGVEISVKCYPLKIFEEKIHKDIFLKEIVNSHIIFLNVEQFIQKVMKNR